MEYTFLLFYYLFLIFIIYIALSKLIIKLDRIICLYSIKKNYVFKNRSFNRYFFFFFNISFITACYLFFIKILILFFKK